MKHFNSFVFKSYEFDQANKTLSLVYSFDNELTFTEEYYFDFPFVDFSQTQLERAFEQLFFMAGVSYYKAYPSAQIIIEAGKLDTNAANFYAKTYQRGLGEYFFVNQLNPRTEIPFAANSEPLQPEKANVQPGLLVGLGGGKDSLVSIEMLRSQGRIATWSLGHKAQLQPLIDQIDLPHLHVERKIDPLLLEQNSLGARNGHVPLSAILACVSTIVGILGGYATSVVSNEHSANEPTLNYNGTFINHQYSKSSEFEQDFQQSLLHHFGNALTYFSFLRPLTELHIAELFAVYAFDTYKSTFSSCNRAFIQSSNAMSWCGECSKCAFVFLILSPFIPREELEQLWSGKNLLLSPELETTYKQLLGIEGDKPLDCVGEIKESRAAMRLVQQQYPELAKYEFDLPADYDFRALADHHMPQTLYDLLLSRIARSPNYIVE